MNLDGIPKALTSHGKGLGFTTIAITIAITTIAIMIITKHEPGPSIQSTHWSLQRAGVHHHR